MIFTGYDIETAGDEEGFALQPWRVREGTSRITLTAAWRDGMPPLVLNGRHEQGLEILRNQGHPVALFNGIFDLAYLYASGHNILDIKWFDVMLLWKWLENSQTFEYHPHDLKTAAIRFLPFWEDLQEFVALKESGDGVSHDDPYWDRRVAMDAQATAMIAGEIWPQLTRQQQRSATIQAVGLPTVAASWVNGVHINVGEIQGAERPIVKEMLEIETRLGLNELGSTVDKYVPSKVLRSPVKLGNLIYETYRLPCTRWTDGGKSGNKSPSADKTALTYLSERDDRVMHIMRWRRLNTIHTKFISGALKTCEYLKSPVTHSAPRVFSTYTGRMTYSSKIKNKFKVGIPIHQMPREKEVRSYVVAPPGHFIVEYDAKGQEMRGMATVSRDQTMIELFNNKPPYDNGHALTGAAIGGWNFEEFLQAKRDGVEEVAGPHGLYMQGKFVNLSKGYRASDPTLRVTARVDYNMEVDLPTVSMWSRKYHNLFPGVKDYWLMAPRKARADGYAGTLADRRYGIKKWSKEWQWTSSSTAINFPIQGMGADQRDLAIATVAQFPDIWDRFYFDLHDGLYLSIPHNWPVSYLQTVLAALDSIDYGAHWFEEPPVPFVWEGSLGPDWGHKVDFDYSSDGTKTLMDFYEERK